MKERIKPPKETRDELLHSLSEEFVARDMSSADQIEFLLPYFTSADLLGIRDQLRAMPLQPLPRRST